MCDSKTARVLFRPVSPDHRLSGSWCLLFYGSGFMTTWQTCCTHYWSLSQSLNILALVSAEGLAHSVSGAGVGEPQSGAGYQKQTAPPAGEEDDGAWQTGETRGEWKYSLGNKTSDATEKKKGWFIFPFRKTKMWCWMRALRRSSRRMRTWKPAWIDMLHCQGKSSLMKMYVVPAWCVQ